MNKKEFLRVLEKRLSILNEDERKDIIDEYKDTIREKVKNGQTEEEAIKDFGDIDDLVKELLSAYKLDPEYENKDKSSFDHILDEGENVIKKGADKLAGFSKNLYHRFLNSNREINLSLIFEILIKIFLVVLALALLRLPFILFENLGGQIFDAFFSPFNEILMVVWKICLMILYLVVCILVVIATFKQYFEGDNVSEKKDIKETKASEIKEEQAPINSRKSNKEPRDHTTVGDVLIMVLKVWVVLFVIVPLVLLDCLALIGLCFAVFYFVKGIDLLGLSILLLGGVVLITYLIKLLYNLVFSKKKITFIPAIGGIVLVVIGSIMFFDMIMNIDYIDGSPYKEKMTTKEEEFTISHDNFYLGLPYYLDGVTKNIDNNMADNVIKVKVTYDENINNISFDQDYNYSVEDCDYDDNGYETNCSTTTYDYIYVYADNENFEDFRKDYDKFIENLKDNKVYSYNYTDSMKVEITANEKTLSKLSYE